jgi:hypothetical protein
MRKGMVVAALVAAALGVGAPTASASTSSRHSGGVHPSEEAARAYSYAGKQLSILSRSLTLADVERRLKVLEHPSER